MSALFLRRQLILEVDAGRTGRDLGTLTWYSVMVFWKLAALYEYSRRRGVDAYYADPPLVASFLQAADRLIEGAL